MTINKAGDNANTETEFLSIRHFCWTQIAVLSVVCCGSKHAVVFFSPTSYIRTKRPGLSFGQKLALKVV